jgi:hypothetical protein
MAQEHRQKLSASPPVEFNFGPAFLDGDDIDTLTITVPTGVTEILDRRVVVAQIAQVRFNISGATVGKTYAVRAQALTDLGDVEIIDLDIVVEAD